MRIRFMLLPVLVLLAVSGCVSASKTAAEFREKVSSFFIPKVETFEANRSYDDVIATFRERVPECLDVTHRSDSQYGLYYNNWNPTLIIEDGKAELHVQYRVDKDVVTYNNPDKGDFVIVADIAPAGAGKTSVKMYLSSAKGAPDIAQAVRHWAEGVNTRCPKI